MRTTPDQLRLAAEIIEKNLPWEWLFNRGKLEWRDPILPANVELYVAQGTQIRLKPWTPKFKVGDRVNVPCAGVHGEHIRDIPCEGVYGVGKYGARYTEGQIELAPWTLSRHLPGFRALRDGEEWMHLQSDQSWIEGDLEEGERPLLNGELTGQDDLVWAYGQGPWTAPLAVYRMDNSMNKHKTRRPLPEPPKLVPLEASDVPPGSVFRNQIWREGVYIQPVLVTENRVVWLRYTLSGQVISEALTFSDLMKEWQILRPGQTEWQACSKPEGGAP